MPDVDLLTFPSFLPLLPSFLPPGTRSGSLKGHAFLNTVISSGLIDSRAPRITKVTGVPFIKWHKWSAHIRSYPHAWESTNEGWIHLQLGFSPEPQGHFPNASWMLKLTMLKGRWKTSSGFFLLSHIPYWLCISFNGTIIVPDHQVHPQLSASVLASYNHSCVGSASMKSLVFPLSPPQMRSFHLSSWSFPNWFLSSGLSPLSLQCGWINLLRSVRQFWEGKFNVFLNPVYPQIIISTHVLSVLKISMHFSSWQFFGIWCAFYS